MTPAVRRLLHWGLTAAAVALLALLARAVDWSQTWQAMRSAFGRLLLAPVAVNLASLLTRGVRWWIFLRRAGSPSLGTALRGAVVGSGLNNLLPASGGEAVRVLFVARHAGASSAAVLATVALDRLIELVSSVALLAAAPLVVPLPAALARWRVHTFAVLVVLLLACALLARRAAAAARAEPGATSAAAVAGERGRLRAWMARFLVAITALPTARRLLVALGLSMLSWTGQIATYHLTARAAGFPAPLVASVAAMFAVNVAFVFQLTPGNVGVFQLLYALVMRAFGLSHHAAVGVALMIQAVQIVPVTASAVLLAPRLVLGRLRHAPPDASAVES